MTLTEARVILGLGPDEDPRPHLAEFRKARERIAEMVRSAPNETLAMRYQQGLVEFDRALAAVREYLEAIGLAPREPVTPPALPGRPAPQPVREPAPTVELMDDVLEYQDEPAPAGRRMAAFCMWLLVIALGAAAGGWFYLEYEENRTLQRQARIALLEKQGAGYIENRRWPEAGAVFGEIEALSPGSEIARQGRRGIEAGMAEEQSQFVAYWTGEARAALEAARWDDAEAAARQVLERFPAETEAARLLASIESGRRAEFRRQALAAVREKLDLREWDAALAAAEAMIARNPTDPEAIALRTDVLKARDKATADLRRARELLKMAVGRDQGQFDSQAMEWLREASILAPQDEEIAAQLEKMASYTRTLRVPGDYATPTEALAGARDRDRIVLEEGEWKGPLVIEAAVEIQGAGPTKTVISCPAEEGSAVTVGPGARGVRVSGITFRHETFETGEDRYSAALVRGGHAAFFDCRFIGSGGHGLIVIEGGHAEATRCRFADNGWNGVAATGAGSMLEVRESEALRNFGHGMESWDHAAVVFSKNRCEENSRNGIHVDNGPSSATLEGNLLTANREFGLVVSSATGGSIRSNTASRNLLGGVVIRAAAAGIPATGNEADRNLGPGLVLEKGLLADAYLDNTVTGNSGKQVIAGAELSYQDEGPPPSGDNAPPPGAIRVEPPPPLEEP
jgi:parallel beta-helix repeat protein